METMMLGVIFVSIFVFAVVKRRYENSKSNAKIIDFIDMNEKFLSKQSRFPMVKILRFYSEIDSIIIRSLLDSAKIPSYVEFSNMNNLYVGFPIQGYSDSFIFVRLNNVFDAKRILKRYIESARRENRNRYKTDWRQIIEIVVGGYSVPSVHSRYIPELLI